MDAPYPSNVTERVIELLRERTEPDARVAPFAGEFFDRERVERLAADVRVRPVYLVEIERVVVDGAGDGNVIPHALQIVVYACASDLRSEVEQFQTSEQRAFNASLAIEGAEVPAKPGVHSNGHVEFGQIAKEYHYPGVSVHASRHVVRLRYQKQFA